MMSKKTSKKYAKLSDVKKKRSIDEAIVLKLKEEMIDQTKLNSLADLRWEANLTQKELAERLGVDQSRISRLESGDLTRAEVGSLAAYAEAMGGSLEITFHLGEQSVSMISKLEHK